MKILFRTAGGRDVKKQLGMGHIFRCINLSKELKKHEIYFLIEDFGGVTKTLREYEFRNVWKIRSNQRNVDDMKQTLDIIEKRKIDVLIIDRFNISKNYVKELKKVVKVVVISDLKNINYDADLVVNGFIGYKNRIKNNQFGTRCVLGPKFQIINKTYSKKTKYKKRYDLLLTVGGYDALNNIEKILKELVLNKQKLKICVVLGPATENKEKIKNIIHNSIHEFTIIKSTQDMKKLISQSRFGMCGGGITTYEFASQKVPFAIVCQYPHQLITARVWQIKKIARNMKFLKDNRQIRCLINDIIDKKMKLKKTDLIDGLGTSRVAREILQLNSN